LVSDKDGIETLRGFFLKKDINHLKEHSKPYHYTEDGVFAPTDIMFAQAVFERIGLDSVQSFVDLGSGDGRIVFLASHFTRSSGVEKNEALLDESIESSKLLNIECDLVCDDYLNVDLSRFDVIFISPDAHFHHGLEKKLKAEMDGVLVVNSPLYLPRFLKKVDSFTIAGMPITLFRNI